ncbi:hypothetical protein F4821DRAFT_235205 [Hypoxylon rubiginosum]|uniref:Uncharacterized protein n=1 Tax=Hypoxylon rubiginosum TaxID=110542 RepID=A0ACC0D4V8_9PEZI|nr:hypothetical protein F4821DRAFT_235205 [Hypoxylon rubiginosum]
MATPRLARPPTCLDCLRRLARPTTSSSHLSLAFPSLTQTRGVKTTKAEEEDLQGIPVRLLRDIQGFGRKHAIIRVKPGRMRNFWFPKSLAEYMTRQRFQELGLTASAIGVRDRTFGMKLQLEEEGDGTTVFAEDGPLGTRKSKKDTLTLPPQETLALLQTLLPATLTFARKPIATPPPTTPRSPSLAANASTSASISAEPTPAPTATSEPPPSVAIFGSVSTGDVLATVKEYLLEADPSQGGRVALEAESVTILGLDAGDDRVKRLGSFEVLISAGRDLEPVRREVKVVAEE